MENNNENKGFQYTYSAREQAELKRIREKYTPPTEEEKVRAAIAQLSLAVEDKGENIAIPES